MSTSEDLDQYIAKLINENNAWDAFNNFYMRFPYIDNHIDCIYFRMLNSHLNTFIKNKLMLRIEDLVNDPKNSQFKAMLETIKGQYPTQEQYSLFYPIYMQLRKEGFSHKELVT